MSAVCVSVCAVNNTSSPRKQCVLAISETNIAVDSLAQEFHQFIANPKKPNDGRQHLIIRQLTIGSVRSALATWPSIALHVVQKCPQSRTRATLSKVAVSNTIKVSAELDELYDDPDLEVREEAVEEGDAGEGAGDGTEEVVAVGEEAEDGVVSGEAWGSEANDGGWGNGDDNGSGWNTETDAGAGNPSTDSAWY
ncbi:hypothetical protein BOTNAR_0070g00110 [Botryotinia narcissicola]|uniref:Uncharacterized protein n=1 Tax=Botryotinia narcissicola TaxID=278944 RepID=A0A4Z1J316_9HELO|nr:hypothetical protein BOTNAR_0070g00110 [Botryotinia narcissicola]